MYSLPYIKRIEVNTEYTFPLLFSPLKMGKFSIYPLSNV